MNHYLCFEAPGVTKNNACYSDILPLSISVCRVIAEAEYSTDLRAAAELYAVKRNTLLPKSTKYSKNFRLKGDR